jgi:hypothetical protein
MIVDGTPTSRADGRLTTKVVHLALPVRWTLIGQQSRSAPQTACTYDVHPHGARLVSSRALNIGDLIMVERGRNKAICQVVWSADPASGLRGQFAVRCVGGRAPWEEELRRMEEVYQPLVAEGFERRTPSSGTSRPHANRRRRPRFSVEGQAEVIDGVQRVAAEVQQISECGARLAAMEPLRPGTDFRLLMNVFDVRLALKAQVKYLGDKLGMGVEFQQIRRGDRPLLEYVLGKVKTRRVAEFERIEGNDPLAATAVSGAVPRP